MLRRVNYHTHTTRCGHAVGSDRAYVESAIKGGYEVLGFSDHSPWRYADRGFVSGIRMKPDLLPDYVRSVRDLQERYKDRIEIRLGLECEYFGDYVPWLRRMIRRERIDYVIFGNHYYESDERYPYFGHNTHTWEMLDLYEQSALQGIESGLFAYMAHPDLFMRSYARFDERCEKISRSICRRAAQVGLPLEYNVSLIEYNEIKGVVGFPHPAFWEIAAAEGCTAIVGMDAHNNRDLERSTYYDRGIAALQGLGMKITDTIPYLNG